MSSLSRFMAIIRESQNNPAPAPIIQPIDDGLELKSFIVADGVDAVTVISGYEHHPSAVVEYTVNETKISGWIIRTGFPKFSDEYKKYLWVLETHHF